MNRFILTESPLADLKIVTRKPLEDHRGFFTRLFCAEDLESAGWKGPLAQINHSFTRQKGIVKGLHFQRAPHSEMKLVSCIHGAIFDVAVDLRQHSPTFLQWFGVQLSSANCKAMLIPEGFAHGFQALTDDVEVLYCTSYPYTPQSEGGLHPEDPLLNISWPLQIEALSMRDREHKFIMPNFTGI